MSLLRKGKTQKGAVKRDGAGLAKAAPAACCRSGTASLRKPDFAEGVEETDTPPEKNISKDQSAAIVWAPKTRFDDGEVAGGEL